MRVVFAGTPDFAVPTLAALLASAHPVVAVYTQPDRPAGRGRKIEAGPVKRLALTHALPIQQPQTLKDGAATLAALRPDALVVVAYGLILPPAILAVPRHGGINVHASLLPRWRGAAPIQRALLAGDTETGISIMQMERGLDTGPILAQQTLTIDASDTAGALHDRLATLGAKLLVATLDRLEKGAVTPQPQDSARATYAAKLTKDEARIDWREPAALLARKVRGYNPWPGAHCLWHADSLRIWAASAQVRAAHKPPGTVLAAGAHGIDVATGDGVLTITSLQRAGGTRQDAATFVRGHSFPENTVLQ